MEETKEGGYNNNVPLPPGTGDKTYMYALKETSIPLAEEFKPQFIIVNEGGDPHFADTLGSLQLTVNGFFELFHTIVDVAKKFVKAKWF